MITHKFQPKDSVLCGHYSLAMIADVEPKEIVQRLGNGASNLAKLAKLAQNYMNVTETNGYIDNRKHIDLSGYGIIAIEYSRAKMGHAMAFHNGKIYDPEGTEFENMAHMKQWYRKYWGKVRVCGILRAERIEYREFEVADK